MSSEAPPSATPLPTPDKEKQEPPPPLGYTSRSYATRKTVAQGLLDFALLMANASQLKALLDQPVLQRDVFFIPNLSLIGVSILLQVVTGIMLLILGSMHAKTEAAQRRSNTLNNAITGLILLITVVNVFISAFGFKFSSALQADPTTSAPVP